MTCRVEGYIPSSLTFLLAASSSPATVTVLSCFSQEGLGERWSPSCRFDSPHPQLPPKTLAGCTATFSQDGHKQRTAQAIGRSARQLAISGRSDEAEDHINCTVNTRDGASYRCSRTGQLASRGPRASWQTPHSDVCCTAMAGGKNGSGIQGHAATDPGEQSAGGDRNAVLLAAGRC